MVRFVVSIVLAVWLAAPLAFADRPVLSGAVIRVIDGDTIDVELSSGLIRVRLNGIDAPERDQPGGKRATAALSAWVLSKRVELEPFEQDRYERLVANVFTGDLDVNAQLVREGHAWAYRQYLTSENLGLCEVEAQARAEGRGLWALPPQERYAPWDWRKRPRRFVDYSQETARSCMEAALVR